MARTGSYRAVQLIAGASILALAACDGGGFGARSGAAPARSALAVATIAPPAPDSRGVITYATYQVIVAREADTIPAMAGRVGLSPGELARHNGLPITYRPRSGEVLALPRNVGGAVVQSPTGWSESLAVSALELAGSGRADVSDIGRPDEPLRHRVEAGDTAYSIARMYNVSVTALASWNGLGPDLTVRIGQELIIPVPDTTPPRIAATAPAAAPRAPVATTQPAPRPAQQVEPTPQPAPAPAPQPSAAPKPSTTPASSRFQKPVEGPVARPYSPQPGAKKNDGIDFAVPAGTAVKVAEDGTVALVSESLGGLGTIVLVRHANELMTIYGRISNVTVKKGDVVKRGQVIGVVATADNPMMHFEVRKGTESVDPTPYLK